MLSLMLYSSAIVTKVNINNISVSCTCTCLSWLGH